MITYFTYALYSLLLHDIDKTEISYQEGWSTQSLARAVLPIPQMLLKFTSAYKLAEIVAASIQITNWLGKLGEWLEVNRINFYGDLV